MVEGLRAFQTKMVERIPAMEQSVLDEMGANGMSAAVGQMTIAPIGSG